MSKEPPHNPFGSQFGQPGDRYDPFGDRSGNVPGGNVPGGNVPDGNVPGGTPAQPVRQPLGAGRSSQGPSTLMIVLIVLGIVGGLILVCCLGGLAISYFGIGALSEMVKQDYKDHPVVREHLGEIESVSFNVMATGRESERHPEDRLVFDVVGSQASGQIILYDQRGDEFQKAILRVGGEDYELDD